LNEVNVSKEMLCTLKPFLFFHFKMGHALGFSHMAHNRPIYVIYVCVTQICNKEIKLPERHNFYSPSFKCEKFFMREIRQGTLNRRIGGWRMSAWFSCFKSSVGILKINISYYQNDVCILAGTH